MKLFLIMLISIFLGVNGHEKLTVTQEGNVTTIQIGDVIYKSSESYIGEAWSDTHGNYPDVEQGKQN